jgi:hypothetical protein
MTVRTQLILPRWSPRPEQTEGEADETYGEREREAEARLLAVRPEQVRLEPQQGLTVVEVPTLNDAYARASMRLEPRRRTHAGNVFLEAFWWSDPRPGPPRFSLPDRPQLLLRLDEIRHAVDLGSWTCPSSP